MARILDFQVQKKKFSGLNSFCHQASFILTHISLPPSFPPSPLTPATYSLKYHPIAIYPPTYLYFPVIHPPLYPSTIDTYSHPSVHPSIDTIVHWCISFRNTQIESPVLLSFSNFKRNKLGNVVCSLLHYPHLASYILTVMLYTFQIFSQVLKQHTELWRKRPWKCRWLISWSVIR